jgi:hypothetical protein
MASPKMWRYFDIFFDKFKVPHWLINYNKTTRSAKRGGKKDWPFWAFYIAFAYSHGLLLLYYHLKYAVFSDAEIVSQKDLRVILVMLFTSIMVLVAASIYTIVLNEASFVKAGSGIGRFQSIFEGEI